MGGALIGATLAQVSSVSRCVCVCVFRLFVSFPTTACICLGEATLVNLHLKGKSVSTPVMESTIPRGISQLEPGPYKYSWSWCWQASV